jgi:hypothetical protein
MTYGMVILYSWTAEDLDVNGMALTLLIIALDKNLVVKTF